jgi:hypothetical protein
MRMTTGAVAAARTNGAVHKIANANRHTVDNWFLTFMLPYVIEM